MKGVVMDTIRDKVVEGIMTGMRDFVESETVRKNNSKLFNVGEKPEVQPFYSLSPLCAYAVLKTMENNYELRDMIELIRKQL